jgi:putative ABC transport system ATP-binding protein
MTRILKATQIAHHFGEEHCLRGVDVDIYGGERVALMGPSGSGKSTLLRIVAGFLAPVSGTVEKPKQIATVNQDFQLLRHLSALRNIALPLVIAGVSAPKAQVQAKKQLQRFGLSALSEKPVGVLSQGQAQRIALARALVMKPDLLLLDEPISALDQKSTQDMLDILDGWCTDKRGILMITHIPLVAEWCTRSLHLESGTLTKQEVAP